MSQTLNLRLGIFAQKEEYNMQDLKNIIKLLGMAAYVIAAIGGFAYMVYMQKYIIAAAILVLAIMAWPTFRKMWPGKNSMKKENV